MEAVAGGWHARPGLWAGIAMTVGPGAASVPANGGAQIFDNFDPGDPARIFLGRRGFQLFDAKPPVWAGPMPGRRRRCCIPVVPTGSGCPLAPMLENKLRLSLTEVIVSPQKRAPHDPGAQVLM